MIKSLLPLNTTDEQLALEQVGSKHLDFDLKNLTTIPKDTPVEILPYLAYMLDVDIKSLEVSEQRILIQNALEIHRHKGTIRSVKLALKSIFNNAEISEWFNNSNLEPYHFEVIFSLRANDKTSYSEAKFRKVEKLINSSKNVKSVFNGFNLKMPLIGTNTYIAVGRTSNLKLKNELTFKKSEVPLIIGVGGKTDIKMRNDLAFKQSQVQINIQGAGIWTV
jgi:phage tail P2-like protein